MPENRKNKMNPALPKANPTADAQSLARAAQIELTGWGQTAVPDSEYTRHPATAPLADPKIHPRLPQDLAEQLNPLEEPIIP